MQENYLTKQNLYEKFIPEEEEKLSIYKMALANIEAANIEGATIKGEYLSVGDLVECEWSNGVVNYGVVKEFGATYDGVLFPVLFKCKKNFSPKKEIMSGTWLIYRNMLNIKKKINYNIHRCNNLEK